MLGATYFLVEYFIVNSYQTRLHSAQSHSDVAREVFKVKASALSELSEQLNEDAFNAAVELILNTRGRVVVSGVGKSGLVGRKICATLASTGTPSFFMHPTEAFHGDLGMLKSMDTMLLISYSGETEELLKLVQPLKNLAVPIISLTGKPQSTLAQCSDAHLEVAVDFEVCPNNLAPTTSTTVTMSMGDALAVALAKARGFAPEDFALRHPGGSLGKQLLARVADHMYKDNLPVCTPTTSLCDAISVITEGRLGLCVVEVDSKIVGIVTDGDLRRALQTHADFTQVTVAQVMTQNPKMVAPSLRLAEAQEYMKAHRIKSLVVSADGRTLAGVLDVYCQ